MAQVMSSHSQSNDQFFFLCGGLMLGECCDSILTSRFDPFSVRLSWHRFFSSTEFIHCAKIILNKMSIESCDFCFIYILFKNNALPSPNVKREQKEKKRRRTGDPELEFQWKMANGMFNAVHFFPSFSSANLHNKIC